MNKNENIALHTLGNGLRLVHVQRNSPVAWCGLAVNAGSRDELEGQYGLAHFVEHTIFKGTKRRSSTRINNRMEQVGGELNAYTTKESTMLYCIFPVEHLERAVELIADLVENSVFPEHELSTELDVVLEEVASYRDTPSEAVYDDFEDMLLAGSQLGHNILGEEKDLR
ncbi:MAG: insulinase family protein, partial [Muribaculaceae bacterium]|nr:insulinase family protein [Muribaculaceae bacterium]